MMDEDKYGYMPNVSEGDVRIARKLVELASNIRQLSEDKQISFLEGCIAAAKVQVQCLPKLAIVFVILSTVLGIIGAGILALSAMFVLQHLYYALFP